MAIHPKMEAVEHLLRRMIMNGEYTNSPYTHHPQVLKRAWSSLLSKVQLPTVQDDAAMQISFRYSERMDDLWSDFKFKIKQFSHNSINTKYKINII